MTAASAASQRVHPTVFVILGGLVAGVLDIVYACGYWAVVAGVPPQRILQSVAAGLLGEASYSGGAGSAVLGLFLHLAIATAMSATYYMAARRWELLWRKPLLSGVVYGLMLYVIMNYVVVPLSAAEPGPKDVQWISLTVVVHALLIGVPIALFARRAVRGG